MSYQPLSEVRKTLRVDWYRCPIEHTKLRKLSNRSDVQGWFQAGGHIALYLFTGIVSYMLWSHQNWFGFILALFLHGTVTSFFAGIAPHELGHATVFRTKQLNKIFLYLTSLLSWFDTFDYNTSHTYHHRYTLHPDGDREVLLPLHPNVGKTFLLQMFTINLATRRGRTLGNGFFQKLVQTFKAARGKAHSNEWIHTLHIDQPDQRLNSVWWARTLLVFHGSVLITSIATGLWVLPILISLAPFIANWAAYFVSMPQHCGLMDKVPDFRKSVRSMHLNPVLEFLYWRMNWHAEHHMYAGVPCYNLKKLYKQIAHDMPEPRTLIGAWREMLGIWQRQETDPSYQFDTPLPVGAGRIRTDVPDELESSIGELAPRGLRYKDPYLD
jgi:fatty acid desaturase